MTDISVKFEPVQTPTELTIDELARRVGMSVRNLREWRAQGLLPPPRMRGRGGYYEEAQVARLQRIRQLHGEGFPLDLIRRLLEASGDAGDAAMSFASALRAPFREEHPPPANLEELARTWGVSDPLPLVRRAVELGLIRKIGQGRYEFTSARVARVGDALHRLGLSADETLAATAEVRAHADGIADVFHRVWLTHLWEPFVEAGMPEERWPEISQTLAEVQPIAMDAVIGLFAVAMEAEIEEGIGREVQRARAQHPGDSAS